ncbi:hypothetical protein [Streptomyces griseus]|uniref:hypothetical protein n=1 Tax=Streptomyces griseus TaxID=1911 RepID=UPI00351A1AE0
MRETHSHLVARAAPGGPHHVRTSDDDPLICQESRPGHVAGTGKDLDDRGSP